MSKLLTADDMAELLSVSKETITTWLSRSPEKLPRRLPGFQGKGPRWRMSDYEEWVEQLANEPARRGRPRTQASGPQL